MLLNFEAVTPCSREWKNTLNSSQCSWNEKKLMTADSSNPLPITPVLVFLKMSLLIEVMLRKITKLLIDIFALIEDNV